MNFIEELKLRGMIHSITPGAEEFLASRKDIAGYAGFDPTATSLHIGHLIPVMMLVHFQRSGYQPIALVGGATGMVGDPSGKSEERKLLSIDTVMYNLECLKKQLEKFLDFSKKNGAQIVNNYDWFKDFLFLDFLREVGKHITVNYMVGKESVKNRWENGISFTEFSYQLLQGYDFYWLYKNKGCFIQMGGSDQWGNITTGVELVRRMANGEVHGITCPLLTRSDGKKFGKTASGESVWLDPKLTSPYKFYQYWLNTTDEDAPKLLRMFTLLSIEEIEALEKEHSSSPNLRVLQKALAKDITIRVHSKEDLQKAVEASEILFGQGTTETLKKMCEEDFLAVFEGVPQSDISKNELEKGIPLISLLTEKCGIFSSKGEVRRLIASGGLSLNKQKCTEAEQQITNDNLLQGKYLLFQKGKKNYFIVKAN